MPAEPASHNRYTRIHAMVKLTGILWLEIDKPTSV